MAHTYGEVLERSYPQIFDHIRMPGEHSAILDIGSGYAGILFAAVQQHACIAIGIGPAPPFPRCDDVPCFVPPQPLVCAHASRSAS